MSIQKSSSKNLLAILGSPHQHGSTAAMLHYAIDCAVKNGWEVHTICLYEKNLAFCTGCRSCLTTGRCVQNDDIREIEESLKTCGRVILAAPVYWANVPAAVKNMFDRLLGTAMEETKTFPRPRLSKNQEYLLLTACNTPFPFSWLCGQSRGAVRAMEEFFRTSGMRRLGCVVFSQATGKSSLPERVKKRIEHFL